MSYGLLRLIIAVLILVGFGGFARANQEFYCYIGTYTGEKSKGIYVARFNAGTGKLSAPELAAEVPSPSFLAIHPSSKFLYAVSEISNFDGKKSGGVAAFAIDAGSGKLKALNKQSSGGAGPCHLVVDATGKTVLVANYGGGTVASLPIEEDGSLEAPVSVIQHEGSSVNASRQKEPHAHSINLDPNNRFAVAADLGLDKLLVYRFDASKSTLTPNNPPHASVKAGSGPRHFTFHNKAAYAYVINELVCTVTAFRYDAERGELGELQTISTLPPGEELKRGYSTAEIRMHPTLNYLYGSNRGHDTIAAFKVEESGKLQHVGNFSTEGKTPRNFAIDPTGNYLLAENQGSHSVVIFKIDAKTGKLEPTGDKVEVGSPVCIRFVPIKL